LIYPSHLKMTGLHIGLASLGGVLKKGGYDVKVFDTAFYDLKGEKEWGQERADRLMSKRIINEAQHWKIKITDAKNDLIQLIDEYRPKVVGISITEPNYEIALTLTRSIKQRRKDIIIIAGGVFPTLSPDIVIRENSIDIVCLGEGETALLELCDRAYGNQDFSDIKGLWVKDKNKICKNSMGVLHNINNLPYPDFSIFEQPLFYKPMQGKLYKMLSVETSRGCPYNCTYCSSPKLKEFYLENSGSGHNYYRNKKMEKVIEEIHYQIDKYSPEFIFFATETFLAMSKKDFDMFIEEYRKIKIPFWFQTRFETISEYNIKALKEVGMFWLTLGVEHGSEQFRKDILKRTYSDKLIIEAISILKKCGMGATLNNILGLPFENRKLIFETIKLNKKLFEINDKLEFNIFMFVPYRGSELYDLCKKNDLLPDEDYFGGNSLKDESSLNFPKEYKEELSGLIKTFNLYVKLPEKYYPQIKIAEKSDEKSAEIFNHLSQLLQ